MLKTPFVVLDLETSGANPKDDEIIEVALIRYEQGKETERYSALIRNKRPLSKLITLITGITDALLKEEGKPKDEVFATVARLLKGAYLVCHNVSFDHSFLYARGLTEGVVGLIDTIPLAQILCPSASSYSLEALTDDLGIDHRTRHRAMGDTEATLELFRKLWEKTNALTVSLLNEIRRHAPRSNWGGAVFFEEAQGKSIGGSMGETSQEISQGVPTPLEVDEILGSNGLLKKEWPSYEPRPQQVDMAHHVMDAFEQGYPLICEAPTGVGKSLAYLIPSVAIALRDKSKVVLSTNTLNLQEQLYQKDIPLLQRLYRQAGHAGFRVALLKGRSHYLCLRRLAKFKASVRFSDTEIILLIKILVWQHTTTAEDAGEMHLSHDETLLWNFELSADSEHCTPQLCQAYGECFLQRARRLAEQADLVVVNHALLCADLKSEGSLLPEYRYLAIDEAHHFEEAVTDAFGLDIDQEHFTVPFRVIRLHLEDTQRRFPTALLGGTPLPALLGTSHETLSDLETGFDRLFTQASAFASTQLEETGYVENLLVDPTIQGMEAWMDLTLTADQVATSLLEWVQGLRALADGFTTFSQTDSKEASELAAELMQEADALSEQGRALKTFFSQDPLLQYIRWLTFDAKGNVGFHLAPTLPGAFLKEKLYDKKKSILLTSATLGIRLHDRRSEEANGHPFAYLRTLLSLDERFQEVVLSSPFDYERQALVMLPTDAVPVTATKSVAQLTPFFDVLLRTLQGNTLGLFTSYKMIETLYMTLAEPLQAAGIRLLAQRLSGGRNKILKAYLSNPDHSVLFGTNSFWEGVDIKGDALTTLIIHKLPFDPPTDPIHKARSQLFHNGFTEYSVPRAILKFRQGFGRLIRSASDYGVMMVLDERVLSKDYGRLFLDALPDGLLIEKYSLAEIPPKAKEWLDLNKSENT